jgi:hypothetical protein
MVSVSSSVLRAGGLPGDLFVTLSIFAAGRDLGYRRGLMWKTIGAGRDHDRIVGICG